MERFQQEQLKLIASVSTKKRYLYDLIDWNERCIGILGARGTGKTTMMLQHVRERYGNSDNALYISVDSPYFLAHNLFDLAKEFHELGGELLLLDEIHKYPDWSLHIKSMYDSLPKLRIVFSGSSLLQISRQKADLSRRAIIFNLHGLSLREYINFVHETAFPACTLETILENHRQIAETISMEITVRKSLRDYLINGYYPFFLESSGTYPFRLREVINHILEVDLPYVNRIETRQLSKLKKLLFLLATSVPFTPNITKLAEVTEISRSRLYEYLENLQNARLLNLVRSHGRGYEVMSKPEKIFLENSNLMYAITENINTGTLRELFFVNQIRNTCTLHPSLVDTSIEVSAKGDFFVNNMYTFEIGGKSKGYRQISGIEKSFLVVDDLEIGYRNTIPLWLFGFLY
ncbi:MAG: AAA family ATPase [Chlorobium sp.]|nr:MAG: AAA family ATPase [Chlorobium sp.]